MVTDPQVIVDKIDNEGWPDALEWLYNDDFGDDTLNQLIHEAIEMHEILEDLRKKIEDRLEELGVDVYI